MNFLDRFKAVLPKEIDFMDIYSLVPTDLWETNCREAVTLAIERADIFDKKVYFEMYQDVRNAKIDPIEHYVRYGIEEGRNFVYKTKDYKKKVAIGLQVSYLFEGKGGIERFCVVLGDYLVNNGFDVHFFCLSQNNSNPSYKINNEIKIHFHTSNPSLENRNKLINILKNLDIKIFITTISNLGDFFWPSILIESNIPFYATEHNDPYVIMNSRWSWIGRLSSLIFSKKINLLTKVFNNSVPYQIRNRITNYSNPLDKISFNRKIKKNRIISVGRLCDQKQHDLLIEAFVKIHKFDNSWECVIFGEGPNRSYLEKIIAKNNLHNCVKLPGITDDIGTELATSKIFCMPSLFEGQGIALLEAMSMSLPSVAFDDCLAFKGLVINNYNGILVKDRSSDALAFSLIKLIKNNKFLERLGKNARNFSEKFKKERVLPLWLQTINSIVYSNNFTYNINNNEHFFASRCWFSMCKNHLVLNNKKFVHKKYNNYAIVVPHLYAIGGLETIGVDLVNSLYNRGMNITLLTLDPEGKQLKYNIENGVNIVFFKNQVNDIENKLKQLNLDVIVLLYSWLGVTLWIKALSNFNIPIIYAEHSNPNLVEERMSKNLRLAVLAAADKIVFLLNSYIKSIPLVLQKKAISIPNRIIQCKEYADTSRKINNRYRIVALGRFVNNIKQFDLLINAFKLICSKYQDWDLYIFGDGNDFSKMEAQIIEYNLKDRVFLPGFTNDPYSELKKSNIFCIPSNNEGFPGSLTEALSCGLPSVGFKSCKGVNELIIDGYNGILCEYMTAESLSESLGKLISNSDLRLQMSSNAIKVASKYSPERIYNDWQKLIIDTSKIKKTEISKLSNINSLCMLYAKECSSSDDIYRYHTDFLIKTYNKLKPEISLILPVYNSIRYLSDTICSLDSQTFKNFEVLFVDDCSTDGSYEYLKNQIEVHNNFYLYKTDINLGAGPARNIGIDKSKGKYLCFMDPDDILPKNSLFDRYILAIKSKSPIAYFTTEKFNDGESKLYSSPALKKTYNLKIDCKLNSDIVQLSNLFVGHCACIFLKDYIVTYKCYYGNKRFGEDVIFLCKCLLHSKTVSLSPTTVYHYRIRKGSAIQSLFTFYDLKDFFELYNSVYSIFDSNKFFADVYMFRVFLSWFKGHLAKIKDLKSIVERKEILNYILTIFNNNNIIQRFYSLISKYNLRKSMSTDVMNIIDFINKGMIDNILKLL